MMAELAVFLLCIATIACLVGAGAAFLKDEYVGKTLAVGAAQLQFLGVAAAFIILIVVHMDSDFSVYNVAQYSHSSKPLLYKITGAWGNHEGSILLWALVLTTFAALFSLNIQRLESRLLRNTLAIQSVVLLGTVLFTLFTSNPFARIIPAPLEGNGLNPLLQDIGLAMHPPTLYMGYVGYALAFSLGVAAMLQGKVDAAWARMARPWAMLSWVPLTVGIGMGSWWAYRELGWGGWWFWDPVENASFIPWLAGTALMHSLIVLEKRNMFARWSLLLAIVTFSFSLLGTFLVRSGVLTSVHAFAHDPARGMFILGYFMVVTGGALTLYSYKYDKLAPAQPAQLSLLSREHLLLLNNLLLVVCGGVVLIGTLYPLIMDVLGMPPVSVGPPYYVLTFLPIALPLVALAGIAVHVPWGTGEFKFLFKRLRGALVAAAAATVIALSLFHQDLVLGVAGLAMAGFLLASTLRWAAPTARSWPHWGMVLAHIGFAIFVGSATLNQLLKTEHEMVLNEGEQQTVAGVEVALSAPEHLQASNYEAEIFTLTLNIEGEAHTLYPEYRNYGTGQETKEAAIDYGLTKDWYATVSPIQNQANRWLVRVHQEPGMLWLWLGLALAGAGGMVSLLSSLTPYFRRVHEHRN